MPLYEVGHIKDPENSIFRSIHFSSGLREARLLGHSCRADTASNVYLCTADYEFATPPDHIDVACAFASITVPNHVHLLRAVLSAGAQGNKQDQAVFDLSFPRASLWFRPPTPLEIAATQTGAGIVRALGGPVQILLLAALVLASRGVKELVALGGMFFAGQVVSVLAIPHTGWQPAARFVEAAAALAVAYLAVEVLLLPEAGWRWMIAAVLGLFHGLYFHLFLQETRYRAGYVLAGAGLAELIAIAVLWLVFSRLTRAARALRPVQVSATALLAFGMIWFVLRLRS
ncbi:MAG: HupE/UreJ family protein [Acidobacteriia bacterium]|nr:HupE/UreJ family protein [Terriglobia bacterium]